MECMNRDCKEEMTETGRQYVGKNALSNNDVYRVFYKCPKGHTWSEKVEIEGTSTNSENR